MSVVALLPPPNLAKKELPDKIRRELRKGETIYHSTAACHVSAKHPEGKWIGVVRRNERGRLVKYPVKGFTTPQETLAYVKTLRPDEKGRTHAPIQGEATVADLYAYVRKHMWRGLSAKRQELKESRWRLHIEPYWGEMWLSQVTRRAVQDWITEVEEQIALGKAGTLGVSQFSQCRIDLHGMFDVIGIFDERFEDRQNPFRAQGLRFAKTTQRDRICVESQHFAAIERACTRLVEVSLVTDWVAALFLTSLLSGLRLGEVMALCRDQIDFKQGAILVDRAMREKAQELDPRTMKPVGDVQRVAINLPKGDKLRVVPLSDQLAAILRPWFDRPRIEGAKWNLLFPSEVGYLREENRLRLAFKTLCKRLDELAKHEAKGGRGLPRNPLIEEFQAISLPNVWPEIVFRDTRNSFASYAEEVGVPQATREAILGHGAKGVTNKVYTDVTSKGFQDARKRLTKGWKRL